tara:strand:+ start:3175 stop:3882 length:708 start_codon:yes stop_codon:yes gene_type:complete
MTKMTKTKRQQTMNKNGVRLDNALNPLSVNNGTECWSQWNVIGYRPPTERDDGTIVKRKCECGQSLYHSFLMENRHTKQQVDSIGLNCIKNHFPLESYKVALGLKRKEEDEAEYCDEDTVRQLEYEGKYRCLCRPCRKYSNDANNRYCSSHRKDAMQQGDTQCVFLKNKSKVFSTWKEMVEIDTEYTYGNDCVRMLKNGMISCNILMGYVVNSLLARGFKVVEWKADKKPHLSVA